MNLGLDVTQGLRHGGPPPGQSQTVAGYVSKSKPAPASFSDPLYVVVPDHSPELSEPMPWAHLHGTTLPAQGTAVLVVYDHRHRPYVAWWDGVAPATPTLSYSRSAAGETAAVAAIRVALAQLGLVIDNTTS